MKCDELKALVFSISDLAYVDEPTAQPNFQNPHDHAVYKATEVDALIAKKDEEIRRLKAENLNLKAKNIELQSFYNLHGNVDNYIDQLKAKLESVQASAYADRVDAVMREHRLKRALYKACANWAMNARMVEIEAEPWGENHESRLWAGVYDKCLKKAEEYR